MRWRMEAPCANCPFSESAAGKFLRRTLRPKRWKEITTALRNDIHFTCHKTGDDTGDGTNLMCAGAIEWQRKRGLSSNLQRIMERLDALRQTAEELRPRRRER